MKIFRNLLVISAALVLIVTMASCNSSNSHRNQLNKALNRDLKGEVLTNAQRNTYASCIAEHLAGRISEQGYRSIVNAKNEKEFQKVKFSKKDTLALYDASGVCLTPYVLSSAKKSAAKTTLQNGITAIKATQTGLGDDDYSSITVDLLAQNEPDLRFVDTPLDKSVKVNTVSLLQITPQEVIVQTRELGTGSCYFVKLEASAATLYGSAFVGKNDVCPMTPGTGGGSDYVKTNTAGWSKK